MIFLGESRFVTVIVDKGLGTIWEHFILCRQKPHVYSVVEP